MQEVRGFKSPFGPMLFWCVERDSRLGCKREGASKQDDLNILVTLLRLDNDRTLKSLLIQSMRDTAPFWEGSLAAETPFQTKDQLVTAAQDRKNWRKLKAETYGESHTSLEYDASR